MIKNFLRKKILGKKSSSIEYVNFLRSQGAKIGERTTIFDPRNVYIDETRPYLLDIGDDVQITRNVTILTHGYDWAVLKGLYGEILGSSGKVTIGNNVFIGMNSTILKGVRIGNNVIIGANSLINKDVPDNCVVVGNPMKIICDIDTYYKKRQEAQLQEAVELVNTYFDRFGKAPSLEDLHEFFWLFENRETSTKKAPFSCKKYNHMMNLVGNYEASFEKFQLKKPMFNSFEVFLEYCQNHKNTSV